MSYIDRALHAMQSNFAHEWKAIKQLSYMYVLITQIKGIFKTLFEMFIRTEVS